MQGITNSTANTIKTASTANSHHHHHHIVLANSSNATSNGGNITANGGSGSAAASSVEHCQGCLGLIHDRYYLQVTDKAWHLQCLRCVECKSSLDSQQTCFAKDGLIYCKEDYFK
jgi:hypothetical protein